MNRTAPLARVTPLRARQPLERHAPVPRAGLSGFSVGAATGAPVYGIPRKKRIKPVSAKRAKENRERRAIFTAIYPVRPRCAVPTCTSLADDIHEPLTRARGGSITDPENGVPLCRWHNDMLSSEPESKLGWAYKLGLLKHSWGDGGDAA